MVNSLALQGGYRVRFDITSRLYAALMNYKNRFKQITKQMLKTQNLIQKNIPISSRKIMRAKFRGTVLVWPRRALKRFNALWTQLRAEKEMQITQIGDSEEANNDEDG